MADPLRVRARIAILLGALAHAGLAGPAPAQESSATPLGSSLEVDSLVAIGRLQEAAWAARASGDSARAATLLARLEVVLRSEPRQVAPLSMDSQGVSYTFHLHHDQGVESIFKVDGSDTFCRACGTDRELASYRVDRLLGLDLTPMVVEGRIAREVGDTLSGSIMYFVHDAVESAEAGAAKPDALRFFDAVIGNSDRHPANWLVMPDGRVVAIDHNRSFQYRPGGATRTCWEAEVDSIARPEALGRPFERYRGLPDDSLAAAIAGLDPALVERFVGMRPRVLDRIDARVEEPERSLPLSDCPPDR